MEKLSHESIAAQLQALNGAVMALIAAHPNHKEVAHQMNEMALQWEGLAGAQPVPDTVLNETANQLRRFALFAYSREP